MSLCQNGAPPMFLDWTNVTVTTDQSALTRGVQISMGNPPQIVSLRPSTADSNLYVVNRAQCAPEYNDTCAGTYGGLFDSSKSSTFRQVAEGQWNGTVSSNPNSLSFVYFNDLLQFGNASIYGYPSMYDQVGYGGQGVLPLGYGSDFLRIAVEEEAIPSTVYGMWTGSRSIDYPVDGSVVLGGYDTTRINGSLTTFPSQEKCEMCVVITALSYTDNTGTTNLFSNSSESLQVALNPSQRVLNVPQNVWDKYKTATGGYYNSSYLSYNANAVPTGNVSVTLQNGYTTIIPASELFYFPRTYDDTGKYSILDSSYQISTIVNATNDGYVMDWGIPYMTMNYFVADFKRSQFKMAPAIRTDFSAQGGGYALQASCDPTVKVTASATSSATATASTSAASSGGHSSSNVGPIVGGVVGGVLGLIAIVGGLILLFYRSRRHKNAQTPTEHGTPMMTEQHMPHQGDGSHAGRLSTWTAMSPTEVPSELGGEGKHGTNASINQWLSSQASDVSSFHSSETRSLLTVT
jgi:hypothetical protein